MSTRRVIRQGRQRLGLSQAAFAKAAGVTRGAVQQWEKAGGTAPKRPNQHRVAELLGISVAELLLGGSTVGGRFDDMRHRVPVVSEVEAGNYAAIDNFTPSGDYEMVGISVPLKQHTYALRVHGDSMVGNGDDCLPNGSIVIVEPDMEPMPGDYVVALNEVNETTLKQLVIYGGDMYLRPLNDRYPTKPLGTAVVIGVVRELTKYFR